jgi:hypothetical protein
MRCGGPRDLNCSRPTRPVRKQGASYARKHGPRSIVSIYGGNAETDFLAWVVDQFVDGVGSGPFVRTSSPIALQGR